MFGDKLREIRLARNVSQKQLADVLYISQQAIAKWESNRSSPNPEMINKLADYFGVSVDYLLGREEIKKSPEGDTDYHPHLTEKDERDISKRLNAVLADLGSSGETLMFDGEPLELDDETRKLLIDSLENSIRVGKLIAKQKYTPKK